MHEWDYRKRYRHRQEEERMRPSYYKRKATREWGKKHPAGGSAAGEKPTTLSTTTTTTTTAGDVEQTQPGIHEFPQLGDKGDSGPESELAYASRVLSQSLEGANDRWDLVDAGVDDNYLHAFQVARRAAAESTLDTLAKGRCTPAEEHARKVWRKWMDTTTDPITLE